MTALILSVLGCDTGHQTIVKKEYVGILKDCNVVPSPFNKSCMTEIKTDMFYGVVREIQLLFTTMRMVERLLAQKIQHQNIGFIYNKGN